MFKTSTFLVVFVGEYKLGWKVLHISHSIMVVLVCDYFV